ncbi:MAG: hypothetical protein K2Q45_02420 [Nitrosomonas sp.]|nr:hypothetical protein [Nitrosomonas sp.]
MLRIAVLPLDNDDEDDIVSNNRIRRGLEIVNMFQNFSTLLGPSLLKQIYMYQLVDDLDLTGLSERIVDRVEYADNRGIDYEFALQHIEYLNGGKFNNTSDMTLEEADFCAFSLIWFLRQAQLNFDFRHRDIKVENIILRADIVSEPKAYAFYKNDVADPFCFVSRYVPVVIDYDFSTVLVSQRDEDRQVVGTRYTACPDSLIHFLLMEMESPPPPPTVQSYDWWSLGIVLFEAYMTTYLTPLQRINFALNDMCFSLCFKYAKRKFRDLKKGKFQLKPGETDAVEILRSICFGSMIASIVHETDDLGPPEDPVASDNYPHKDFFFFDDFDEAIAIKQSRDYIMLTRSFALFPKHVKKMLKRLLSWFPEERRWPVESYFEKLYVREPTTGEINTYSDDFNDACVFTNSMKQNKILF